MTGPRYYHGGVPGLRVGDELAGGHPRRVHEGCAACAAHAEGVDHPTEPSTKHPGFVYVTTDREYARYYASLYGLGDLYRVEPVEGAPLVRSDEDSFPTWRAETVRVAGIVTRSVRLTMPERRRLWRHWGAADQMRATAPALPEGDQR